MVRACLSGGSIPAETWRVGGSQTSRELGEESFRQRGNYKSSLSLVRAWYTWRKRKESQGSRVETMRRQVFQGEVRKRGECKIPQGFVSSVDFTLILCGTWSRGWLGCQLSQGRRLLQSFSWEMVLASIRVLHKGRRQEVNNWKHVLETEFIILSDQMGSVSWWLSQ